MKNNTINKSILSRLVLIALVAIYVLIFIGSMVRATGSGMGCPDWPTCFGSLIPPTSLSDLPANFANLYPFYKTAQFSVFNTWTEYFNRLSGVTVGILIFIAFISSIINRKRNPQVMKVMAVVLLTTGFQGWLGAVVVASELSPLMISLHMILAQFIALCLIYAYIKSLNPESIQYPIQISSVSRKLLLLSALAIVVQMIFGLLTRSAVDTITNANVLIRSEWISNLPLSFAIHKTFSIFVVLIFSFSLFYLLKEIKELKKVVRVSPIDNRQIILKQNIALFQKICFLAFAVVSLVFLAGISLARFNFPFVLQPIHLTGATILLGLCVSLLLLTQKKPIKSA